MLTRFPLVACVATGVFTLGVGICAIGVPGQGQAGSTATQTVAGRVIDGDSNEPVEGAEVRLGPPPQFLPPGVRPQDLPRQPRPATVLTDQNGQFSFSNVSAGRYTLNASKAGYIMGFYGGGTRPMTGSSDLDVYAGENVTNVTMRMWRESVIAGAVRTTSGRLVTGATVIAWRVFDTREGAELQRASFPGLQQGGVLDDRGEFRIPHLVPGRYLLCLQSPQAEAAWRLSRVHSVQYSAGECDGFYPNATLPTEALAITLGTGDEHTADIEVPDAIDSVPVSGHVEGLSEVYPKTQVRLLLANGSADFPAGFQVAAVDLGADGAFAFPAVRPGTYLIRGLAIPPAASTGLEMLQPASGNYPSPQSRPDTRTAIRPLPQQRAFWFEQRLDVEHQPLRDVIVHAVPGATVSGRVILDSDLVLSGSELEAIPIYARPYGGGGWDLDGLPMGRIEADGSFRSAALPPDRYSVLPYSEGDWYTESEVVGGRDVQGEGLDVEGRDITDVVVTLTRQRAVVSGTVHDSAGKPRPDASVFAFPAEERNWTFGQMNILRPNGRGQYSQTFSAGAWILVAAVSDLPESGLFLKRDFLRTLAPRGTTVTLTRGEHETVNLSLQEIGKH